MIRRFLAVLVVLAIASIAGASSLPGVHLETIATTSGFLSSVAVDSRGTIYYTTTAGGLFRLDGTVSTTVAILPTQSQGDAGLLGMALIDDHTAAVHYTNMNMTREIISRIDLTTGAETIVAQFVADITGDNRSVSAEHHGGNPTVGPDGSIFFAIGDFGAGVLAQYPEWNAGKIWRVYPDGTKEQFARGIRNTYDLAWDETNQRVISGENGPVEGDEINVISQGDNCGWPFAWGYGDTLPDTKAPVWVFPSTVAPTGVLKLSGRNPMLRGYLFGAFVPSAVFLVPDIDVRPLPAPLTLFSNEKKYVIDVAESPDGSIVVGTFDSIHRLVLPRAGDCDGDGVIDGRDALALAAELADGAVQSIYAVHGGKHAGSFGCDVTGDSFVDRSDLDQLVRTVKVRTRAMGRT